MLSFHGKRLKQLAKHRYSGFAVPRCSDCLIVLAGRLVCVASFHLLSVVHFLLSQLDCFLASMGCLMRFGLGGRKLSTATALHQF